MKRLLIILFTLFSLPLFAQHWYVDNTGTGDTLATIAEVNALTLGADDTVSFKKGCLWRDDVIIAESGTAGHYCVFNTYGTGAKPKIYGSDQALTFTDRGGNVWSSATVLANPFAGDDMEVWFVEPDDSVKWGDQQADTASLTEEYDWAWAANVIYVYAATDPDSRYTSVEVPQRDRVFNLYDAQYIEINGFELAYSLSGAMGDVSTYPYGGDDYTGFTFKNNTAHHFGTVDGGGYGVFVVYNNTLIQDNEIYECGRRGIAFYNYGSDTIENGVFDGNYLHNNYHTTGLDISAGGGTATGSFDSIIVRNNLFEDSDSLSLDNPPSTTYWRTEGTSHNNKIYIYNNIFTYIYGVGLNFDGDVGSNGFNNVYIYNNTFYCVNKIMSDGRMFIDQTGVAGGEWVLKNNIFYFDNDPDDRYGYCFSFSGLTYDQIDADYNLYYTTDAASYIVRQVTPLVRYTAAQFATMQSTWGWEVNSPNPADPLFIDITYPVEVDSLMIDALSPAVDAGIGLAIITTDYRDSLRGASPDIGAYEYNPEDYDPPPTAPGATTGTPYYIYTRLGRCSGVVTEDGGGTVVGGLCWSTSANPTTSDTHVQCRTGEGAFSGYLTGLAANTVYHVRSYATNEETTTYGSDETFTTPVHSVAKTGGKIVKTGGKILIIH